MPPVKNYLFHLITERTDDCKISLQCALSLTETDTLLQRIDDCNYCDEINNYPWKNRMPNFHAVTIKIADFVEIFCTHKDTC